MTAAKVWIGGTWQNVTNRAGSSRIAGAWVPFGPGGSSEALSWPSPPSSTDLDDGAQAYNMGLVFSLVAGKNGIGVRWRVPDSVSSPPLGVHAASLWADGAGTRIAYKEFTPVPGGDQDVLFDSAVALSSGVDYVAAVYTVHYVFRSGSPAGVTSPSGNIVAGAGRLASYNGGASSAPKPTDSFSSSYYVSPLVEV